MIVPDVNLLVYAYNAEAPLHAAARRWWEECMRGDRPVGLAWVVICGFVRIMSHRGVLPVPMAPSKAFDCVEGWLVRPQVEVLDPGPRHLQLLRQLMVALGAGGNLTTDAHLAALTLERQGELHSNDTDFLRFSGLRWVNPLI